ncbi:MAG: ATP synthase F1 subunit delta [Crocinitomicaceae bacterium]|nr:ATP synthase F1 subunit delta [Crocinitomicaceae bacterium]
MAASKAATRYATALLDLSIEMNLLEKVNADVMMLHDLCNSNKDLLAFFHSPIIQKRRKYEVYQALFNGKMDKMTIGFLNLITKNGRENIVPEIAESFIQQYRKHKGIVDVYVTSAVALEPKVKDAIVAKIKTSFKGDVQLHESIDQTLIGGFVVNVDDKQIDASIKSQLTNLKNILLN